MEHFFRSIPGWSTFVPFYADAVAEAPSKGAHFVEVGSWKGRSAAFMGVEIINSNKHIRFECVDHFRGSSEHANDPDVRGGILLQTFLRNVAPVGRVIHVVNLPSLEAVLAYPDASLDFVLIDASHEYEHVLADIQAWLPKIKPGGVIAGDDYGWPGVHRACNEVFGRYVGDGPRGKTLEHACWRVRL